jgi:hypothetical protein
MAVRKYHAVLSRKIQAQLLTSLPLEDRGRVQKGGWAFLETKKCDNQE